MYDVVVKKVHVRYLISWWVSCSPSEKKWLRYRYSVGLLQRLLWSPSNSSLLRVLLERIKATNQNRKFNELYLKQTGFWKGRSTRDQNTAVLPRCRLKKNQEQQQCIQFHFLCFVDCVENIYGNSVSCEKLWLNMLDIDIREIYKYNNCAVKVRIAETISDCP